MSKTRLRGSLFTWHTPKSVGATGKTVSRKDLLVYLGNMVTALYGEVDNNIFFSFDILQ